MLSNDSLDSFLKNKKEPFLEAVLCWSKLVNKDISKSKERTMPFDWVEASLKKAKDYADIVVISSANTDALEKEWNEYGLSPYVKAIAGQEMGTKASCIARVKDGKYKTTHAIMIGDAPGDLDAARENGILFYPIIPKKESISWKRFYEEVLDKFINQQYDRNYESKFIKEFREALSVDYTSRND